jgi:pyruvate ferredoxin oxidoreductase beta subunit
VENGKYRLSDEMPKKLKPVKDYFKAQGRFRHLTEDEVNVIQHKVEIEYKKIIDKAKYLKAWD